MTNIAYQVTAGNLYFYQTLVVLAPDADTAHELFTAYLAIPENQRSEEEEYEMAVQASLDGVLGGNAPARDDYNYRFHDADIKEFTGTSHWSGTPTTEVQLMASDGNG